MQVDTLPLINRMLRYKIRTLRGRINKMEKDKGVVYLLLAIGHLNFVSSCGFAGHMFDSLSMNGFIILSMAALISLIVS